VAQDEELESLVRARRTAPDDSALALRHARLVSRSGDPAAAERLLVQALDETPGDPDLTAALDRIGGGRACGASWPGSAGNARRSRRSSAIGPSRGEVVLRRELVLDSPVRGFAVGRGGKGFVLTGAALYTIDEKGDTELVTPVSRDLRFEQIVLLPAGRILLLSHSHALVLVPRAGRLTNVTHRFSYSSSFAAGASGYLYAAARHGRVDAFKLAVPAEAVPICHTEHDKTGLAIAPGGDLLVAIEGSQRKNRAGRLLRLDPRGRVRFEVVLKERSFGKSLHGPVVDDAGTVYLGFPGLEVFAHDAEGEQVFAAPYAGEPIALAGERGELLVVREDRSLHVLDARTGAVRAHWRNAFFSPPAVDARGWIYARRRDDLVAWDPSLPETPSFTVEGVAVRAWEWAFGGEGRIYAFPNLGSEAEFVVIE
jgi:hypothetical protein